MVGVRSDNVDVQHSPDSRRYLLHIRHCQSRCLTCNNGVRANRHNSSTTRQTAEGIYFDCCLLCKTVSDVTYSTPRCATDMCMRRSNHRTIAKINNIESVCYAREHQELQTMHGQSKPQAVQCRPQQFRRKAKPAALHTILPVQTRTEAGPRRLPRTCLLPASRPPLTVYP